MSDVKTLQHVRVYPEIATQRIQTAVSRLHTYLGEEPCHPGIHHRGAILQRSAAVWKRREERLVDLLVYWVVASLANDKHYLSSKGSPCNRRGARTYPTNIILVRLSL